MNDVDKMALKAKLDVLASTLEFRLPRMEDLQGDRIIRVYRSSCEAIYHPEHPMYQWEKKGNGYQRTFDNYRIVAVTPKRPLTYMEAKEEAWNELKIMLDAVLPDIKASFRSINLEPCMKENN